MLRRLLFCTLLLALALPASVLYGQSGADSMHVNIYPNPAAEGATFQLYFPQGAGEMVITAFDLIGQQSTILIRTDQEYAAGRYDIYFNGFDVNGNRLPCGFYFLTVVVDGKLIGTAEFVNGCQPR
jgi:hypothetical protein